MKTSENGAERCATCGEAGSSDQHAYYPPDGHPFTPAAPERVRPSPGFGRFACPVMGCERLDEHTHQPPSAPELTREEAIRTDIIASADRQIAALRSRLAAAEKALTNLMRASVALEGTPIDNAIDAYVEAEGAEVA